MFGSGKTENLELYSQRCVDFVKTKIFFEETTSHKDILMSRHDCH